MSKKRILVTGGAGFIGSNLAERLLSEGHFVRILDNFSLGKRENVESLSGDLEVLEGSIEEEAICEKAVEGIDCISHQAAFGSVPRSIESPEYYSHINLHGFVNIANCARKAGIKRMVYASSSSVYGDADYSPKVEEKIGQPLSPYAASKLSNEIFAHSFAKCYPMSLVGLRYFNVFGPRQNPQGAYAAVIPLFISSILNGTSAKIYGDGEQSRDFTYIENVIQANISAMFTKGINGSHVLNIACGKNFSVNELYKSIAQIMGSDLKPEHLPPRKGDVRNSLASTQLAKKIIDYSPQIQLMEGLEKTIDWYKSQQS